MFHFPIYLSLVTLILAFLTEAQTQDIQLSVSAESRENFKFQIENFPVATEMS